jgi:uncharacterized protein (DUF1697 family)
MALVTFLRGVNVGGHRSFRPTELVTQLKEKEYDVINIGAAGTFVVRKPVSQTRLRSDLRRLLPFESQVVICSGRELMVACRTNPFDSKPLRSDIVRFVSILSKRPRLSLSIPVCIPASGKWLVRILSRHERFLFGFYRREMKAIGALGSIDKLFGVPATTRNWNTISAILKVLERS